MEETVFKFFGNFIIRFFLKCFFILFLASSFLKVLFWEKFSPWIMNEKGLYQ